jgi:wyosine [tRNA(Phe)-imidazoG37] synthetase (radical SAM superfamily)
MPNEHPKKNGDPAGPANGGSEPGALVPNDPKSYQTAFGQPRNALNNRFVYAVISQRAHGLSVGINMNPDKKCNFDCVYCEVDRDTPGRERRVDTSVLAAELNRVLELVHRGQLRDVAGFAHLPADLLQLKEVALSGDGEPTLCVNFEEVVREVMYFRSMGRFPHFKVVLITNTTGLDLPEVARGLKLLGREDEIWAKLEAGTQGYMDQINRPNIPLWRVLANILTVARKRPVVLQSLFPLVDGEPPPPDEIEQYVQRVKELKAAGAQIALVQVYSAHRPPHRPNCEHVSLKCLSHIARRVRETTGLRAEVF